MSNGLNKYIDLNQKFVNNALIDMIESASIPSDLKNSMLYSIEAGGKRIRPILMIASAEAFGGKKEDVLPLAMALEMIHTYSLIHDD